MQCRRDRGNPSRRQGEGANFLGLSSPEGSWEHGYVSFVVNFSRPSLAVGKILLYQSRTLCQRPWLLRDDFCLCVHTDIISQFRIVAIFTVVDSQTLHQRKLPLFRCISLITTVHNFTYRVSVIHNTQQSKH